MVKSFLFLEQIFLNEICFKWVRIMSVFSYKISCGIIRGDSGFHYGSCSGFYLSIKLRIANKIN
ncbi:MAG: hypothetical protein MjAS7_2044 [Metallosphaera javensis (ex Sakai et al. 2022)]|nr:MAG: hypothetical protein MjAS7_2044 [Metallosphaera javensis (ex Sakai et al. 2022)]